MHVRDLIELASIIVTQAINPSRALWHVTPPSVELYWSAAKTRHEQWMRLIRQYSRTCEIQGPPEQSAAWHAIRPVVEEILASEVLTRVWCAAICHWEVREQRDRFAPVARHVLSAHSEARNRALNILMHDAGSTPAEAKAVNNLRCQLEKWNDVLIGGLLVRFDARSFAFELTRAESYASELLRSKPDAIESSPWHQLQLSLSTALREKLSGMTISGAENRSIAVSIMMNLAADRFVGKPSLRTLWLDRVAEQAQNAAGLVQEALLDEIQPSRRTISYRYDAATGLRAPRF